MKKAKTLILFIFIFSTTLSYAGEYTRDIVINKLHPVAAKRPTNTAMQNFIRVYFTESAGWADVGCRNDSADLDSTDEHLVSTLLMAWATSKPIKVYVDNTLKPDGSVCQITALMIN